MQTDEGIQRDDLVNKIHSAGSKLNKSLPVAALKIEAQRIKQYIDELLALLPK